MRPVVLPQMGYWLFVPPLSLLLHELFQQRWVSFHSTVVMLGLAVYATASHTLRQRRHPPTAIACHHPGLDPLTESTPEEWRAVAGVYLMGALHYCRATLPTLCGSGQIRGPERGQASIVNVSSGYADKGRAGRGLYDATKAGLLAFTGTLAHEEAAFGVRVNAF